MCGRLARGLPFVACLTLVGACGGATNSRTPFPAPVSASPSPSAQPVALDEHDNGLTVQATIGARVTVTLHSTYWTFSGSTNAAVLQPIGGQTVAPMPGGCVPGGGCGTVQMSFAARATGSATVSATRASCGEALQCSAQQSRFAVTVEVG